MRTPIYSPTLFSRSLLQARIAPARVASALVTPVLLAGLLAGCSSSAVSPNGTTQSTATQRQAQVEQIRQQLDLIPPPSKNRYMAVHSLTVWENPYLTVQGGMLTLHVTMADANPSGLGSGGIMRPVAARRQDLNIRTGDLPVALNAIPATAWPYGRVIAIEEAHDTPPAARPQVRRNMEAAMQSLSDLGVVVYEWSEPAPSVR
ncbi:MAG TPA: hypothetical protein VNW54_02035 [Granulicella sp.]|nr:hypothetical protein [Granulicella sp.]